MFLITGGDFTDELQQAGIKEHHMFAVSDMVSSVSSEKFVLYIPFNELVQNRATFVATTALAANISKKK